MKYTNYSDFVKGVDTVALGTLTTFLVGAPVTAIDAAEADKLDKECQAFIASGVLSEYSKRNMEGAISFTGRVSPMGAGFCARATREGVISEKAKQPPAGAAT